jgi:hypothetical protein
MSAGATPRASQEVTAFFLTSTHFACQIRHSSLPGKRQLSLIKVNLEAQEF